MNQTGFKLLAVDLERARRKAGLIPLSRYLRTLTLMWLEGDIEVTEELIKKYDERG